MTLYIVTIENSLYTKQERFTILRTSIETRRLVSQTLAQLLRLVCRLLEL